jgi:transposase-like protein
MQESTTDGLVLPVEQPRDVLTAILRQSAQRALAAAVEAEVEEWIQAHSNLSDDEGHRLVVRNGHQPTRSLQTGIGPVELRRPRVHDRREEDKREQFESTIVPPYLRRSRSVEELIPCLYLHGISTGAFNQALEALLGQAPGLSASTVTRMIEAWQGEYEEWSKRSLAEREYVYVWADGVHVNVRLEEADNARQCMLVLMGARADGTKELIAIADGYRESEQSWRELLRDVQRRGLTVEPNLAVADGALGFWAAMRKIWRTTREQRCWVHKTANVLNKLPQSMQAKAKSRLHDIWQAETREIANRAFDAFVEDYRAKYPKAVDCLVKDREQLLAFYDFPAEHWKHLRTTNPIESTFATVRLRHGRTKGNGSRGACLAMVFKLAQSAEKRWRKLNGYELIPDVIRGVRFVDGVKSNAA